MKMNWKDRLENYNLTYSHERLCAKLVDTEEELIDLKDELSWWSNRFRAVERDNNDLKKINEEHRKLNGELREENKQLKERIDKAIEYCNNNIEFTERLVDVIDILKGDLDEND